MKSFLLLVLSLLISNAMSSEVACFNQDDQIWIFQISNIQVGRRNAEEERGQFKDHFIVKDYKEKKNSIKAIGIFSKMNLATCALQEILNSNAVCKIKREVIYDTKDNTLNWKEYQKQPLDVLWKKTEDTFYYGCAQVSA